ncbi:MAG: ABC transporter permease [Pseudomonadota bacterium]
MSETRVTSAASVSGIGATVDDLVTGWRMGDVWRTFAWDEIQSRYRRSALGLSWIAISYLIFVGGISLFFGGFSSKSGAGFVHHVAIGYAAIMFMIGNLSEGCAVFRGSASWIQSTSMPYSVYVYKGIARSSFPFVIQLSIALTVMVFTGWRPTLMVLWAIPALAMILITSIAVQLALGFIGARFRDVQHLILSVQRLLIFITPVLWVLEEREGMIRAIAMVNPFTHYLQVFRAPLLGDMPDPLSVLAVLGLTVAAWALALVVSSRMRKRLPFWI